MAHRNKSSMDYVSLSCCALAFVLYVNTLNAGFVYDDRRAILGNPDILGSTPWYNMLRNDFWGTPLHDTGSHGSYRPLCVVSFKLNHLVGGFKPVGYHLVNVLLHCLATGLVVKLARHLLPRGWGPAITGTLFAVHPVHTEAVAGVVGRADLTACNFYLLTFLAYIKHVQWREKGDLNQWLALGGTVFLSVAAVLCKETAVTALVVCGLYDGIKGMSGYRDKHRVRSLTILGLSLLLMLHLRLSLPTPATQFSTADNPTAKSHSAWTRFLTFTYLPVFNLNLLLRPTVLSFDWGMDAIPRITTIFDGRNFCSLLFYVTLARTIWKNLNRLRSKNKTNIKSILCHKISRLTTKKKFYQHQQQQQQQHLNSQQQQMQWQHQHQQHQHQQHEQHHHQNLSNNGNGKSHSSIVKFHHLSYGGNDSNNNNNCINKNNNNYANGNTATTNNNNNNVVNDNNNDEHELLQDMVCKICKHGISLRHLSSCRANNNNNNNNNNTNNNNNNNNSSYNNYNNVPSTISSLLTSTVAAASPFLQPCGCPQFKFINKNLSLSPLHSNNNNNNNIHFNNFNTKLITRPSGKPTTATNGDYRYGVTTNNNRTSPNAGKPFKSIVRSAGCGATGALCDSGYSSSSSSSHNNSSTPSSSSFCGGNTSAAVLLSLIILTLPFLPAANLFFYVGFVVAERILYLPSVGYCLLIGLGLGRVLDPGRGPLRGSVRNRKFVVAGLCVVLMALGARTWQRNFDWKNEENLYKSARWINPPKALGNLGSVLSSQGRYEEAKQALLEALKYRPNMADVHYNLGVLLQNQQNYKAAVESFQKAVHFRPSLAVAYLNMGTSLIALGRCREAAAILREGSKLDGHGLRDRTAHENAKISALLQLANLYADQDKLQRAVAIYREALHVLPEYYPPQGIYHRLGDIFARLQQWSEAERFQRAAIEAQPDHIGAHISYGTMLARNTSRSTEAEQWFKRAIRLAPTDASVHHHYAEFLTMMSREVEACEHRVKAAEQTPKDYSLVVAAATALRLLDKKDEAEQWYRQAVYLRPTDARAHTNLGAILHLMGKGHQAISSYKEALKLQPGDPTTMANLAKLGVFEIS